jgi:hypothetical protein
MNQRMLLRVFSQAKPRYIIPKRAAARAVSATGARHNAVVILVVAFVFWLTYFLMRQFGG